MSFESVTLGLLVRPASAPAISDAEDAELQDAHLAHLAALLDRGALVELAPVRLEAGGEVVAQALERRSEIVLHLSGATRRARALPRRRQGVT